MGSKESGRNYLTYKETLRTVEEIMKQSGLRGYCENVCRGYCCGDFCFYDKTIACHTNEGRRLSCSIFLCYDLKELIFSDKVNRIHRRLTDILGACIRKAGHIGNLWHRPHSKETINNFKFGKGGQNLLKKYENELLRNRPIRYKVFKLRSLLSKKEEQSKMIKSKKREQKKKS